MVNRIITVNYFWPLLVANSPKALLNYHRHHQMYFKSTEKELINEYNVKIVGNFQEKVTKIVFPSEEDLTKFLLQWG